MTDKGGDKKKKRKKRCKTECCTWIHLTCRMCSTDLFMYFAWRLFWKLAALRRKCMNKQVPPFQLHMPHWRLQILLKSTGSTFSKYPHKCEWPRICQNLDSYLFSYVFCPFWSRDRAPGLVTLLSQICYHMLSAGLTHVALRSAVLAAQLGDVPQRKKTSMPHPNIKKKNPREKVLLYLDWPNQP